jgi:hypothetical protein
MAQACVLMRPRQEQLFTPGKLPLSPQMDNTLITSTVRKRKGEKAFAAAAAWARWLAGMCGKMPAVPPNGRKQPVG